MLAQMVRLSFCFALLRICDECRDWRDTGDIYGFTGVSNGSFVSCTCLLYNGDCCGAEACAAKLCFSKTSGSITKRCRDVTSNAI